MARVRPIDSDEGLNLELEIQALRKVGLESQQEINRLRKELSEQTKLNWMLTQQNELYKKTIVSMVTGA